MVYLLAYAWNSHGPVLLCNICSEGMARLASECWIGHARQSGMGMGIFGVERML